MLEEIHATVERIEGQVADIKQVQERQARELQVLTKQAARAEQQAQDARRMAEDARSHVEMMVSSVAQHTEAISRSVSDQAETSKRTSAALERLTEVVSNQDVVLKRQDIVLEQQDRALEQVNTKLTALNETDIRRATRDEVLEKYAKSQHEWIRFATPVALGLLTSLVGVVAWFATHVK